jgi:pilus assembly protein CpaC
LPQSETPETLQIHVGKSLVLKSRVPLKRVSVTDPQIASAIIINPNQVLIHGHLPGAVTLILWDEREQMSTYDLAVGLDIGAVRDAIKQVFPNEGIAVAQAGASIVLSGTVSSKAVADLAVQLAQTETKSVVNLLGVPEATGEVLLQVRFAEVDRSTLQQLGINIFSTGAANTVGTVGTQQFGTISGGQGNRITGVIPGQSFGTASTFTLSDLLNIFIFRPDLNLGSTIKALEQRNVLQILAEPNLLALNGREASFLAGGEFPFPVVQPGAGFNAVTILFKEFGVRLKFVPTIGRDGTIRLHVAPEVSSLDFTNSLTIQGFTIPALSTRRSETEIELKDGQSFAIAGLIDNRLTEIASKIPILGDVPIIGHLFRTRSENKTNSELLVMVTPKIVKPLPPGQVPPLPAFPKSFYKLGEKFDGKTGVTPPPKN